MADEELPMPKGVRTRTAHTYTYGSRSECTKNISEFTYDEKANEELRRLAAIGKRHEREALEEARRLSKLGRRMSAGDIVEGAKAFDPESNYRALEPWELGTSAISGSKRILSPKDMDVQVSWLTHEVRKLKEMLRDRT